MPCNSLRRKELSRFEKKAGLRFRRADMLNLAFCHRSYANEHKQLTHNNERLEFLGDSILGLVVADYLFRELPDRPEGDLARIKSFVVSEDSLEELALQLNLDRYILMGKGEENSGGRRKKAILADTMEAVFGACYLDLGFKEARRFILFLLVPQIEKVLDNRHKRDFKTLLQEFCQKKWRDYPHYKLVKASGPDHDRTFSVEVYIKEEVRGRGLGKSKKEAEQQAAEEAYSAIQAQEI